MVQRIAGCFSLITFAVCLLIGGLEAGNPFATTVWRALQAMGVTLVLGMVLGAMAKGMLDENLKMEQEKLKNSQPKTAAKGR